MFRLARRAATALVLALLFAYIPVGAGTTAAAQGITTPESPIIAMESQRNDSGSALSQRFVFDVEDVTLADALKSLVLDGAPLIYSMELVNDIGPVSCACVDSTLDHVLTQLTRGTEISFRPVETGGVLLFQKPRPERGAGAVGTIRGRVTNVEDASPLPSVSVQIVGTSRAVITGSNGTYSITNVPAGEYWVKASLIGYFSDSLQVAVSDGATAVANFALEVNPVAVNPLEVEVSTGSLVETEREKIGNAMVVIPEDEIERSGARDLVELLQGRAPGVTSFRGSSEIGAARHLQVRGVGSILQDQSPLIYVDGVPVDAGSSARNGRGLHALGPGLNEGAHIRLDELTLNEVERIEIIKGPAATTMYGTEALNGVIQIFTKQGVPGETRVTATVEQGVGKTPRVSEFTEGALFTSQIEDLAQSPYTQEYGLDLSGGAGNMSYTLGAIHDRRKGTMLGNRENQTVVRTSVRVVPNDQLSLHLNGNLVQRDFNTRRYGFGLLEDIAFEPIPGALSSFLAETANRYDTDVNRLYGSVRVDYQPFPIWRSRLTVGLDRSTEVNERFGPQFEIGSNDPLGFTRDRATRTFNRFTGNFVTTLSYPRTGPVTSTLSVGGEAFRDDTDRFRLRAAGLPGVGATDFDLAEQLLGGDRFFPSDLSTNVMQVGAFIQEQVGIWDRLFVTGGLRVDGNSSFGDDFGLQTYPKLAASFVSEPTPWWNVKLRSAWGRSGRAPPPFAKDLSLELIRPFATELPTLTFSDPGNANLSPEVGTEWEVGVENYFAGNRASLELNYFQSTTEDAIIRGPVPLSTGFLNGPLANIGEVRSKGVEVSSNVVPIQTRDLNLRVGFTFTHLIENGLITKLGEDSVLTRFNQGFNLAELEGLKVGFSTRELLFTTPGDEVRSAGSRVPTTYGGVNFDVDFMDRVQLYANIVYNFGGNGFNSVLNRRDRALGFHRRSARSLSPELADRYVFSTDEVQLDVIRLFYDLPQALFSTFADEARVWFEGDNLVSWDAFPRGNPAGVPVEPGPFGATGTRGFIVPTPERYKLGLEMTF